MVLYNPQDPFIADNQNPAWGLGNEHEMFCICSFPFVHLIKFFG
jgi:hypothetical protein